MRTTRWSSRCAATRRRTSGAAAGGASAGADSQLQRCTSPLGTIAVDDGRNADWWGQFGSATKVTSIDPLLRLAVQQSNCFVITSIGNQKSDARLSRITQLQRSGGVGGALAGFSSTPEGKATVVAFIDAYNKMVVALRSYKAQDVKGGLGRGGQLQVN
ncbi:hypothetical protein [Burkholderia cenocepacia]|uniref:hypothetical protein n=1 Tax=Burkholderia cenocepacia TaxID=95486 RepID=UPI00286F7907|nr:hypothetical protein [Burkholderia cenocepacia]